MRRPGRRLPLMLTVVGVVALVAVCAALIYQFHLLDGLFYPTYENTSPPLTVSASGVRLRLAHSRYVTAEAFTLDLTNQSSAPIYMPATANSQTVGPKDLRLSDGVILSPDGNLCLAIGWEIRTAQGWQPFGSGCDVRRSCPGGMAPAPPQQAMLVIAPGQTASFPLYNGQNGAQQWAPGVYRFSVQFTNMPFLAPGVTRTPPAIPTSVTLKTPPVTLVDGQKYFGSSPQATPRCPFAE